MSETISFTVTPDDYVNGLRLHMRRYWASRNGLKFCVAAVFVACAWEAVASGFQPAWTAGAIAILALPPCMYFVFLPWQARKIYREQKTLQDSVEVSWSENGYSASTATVTGTTPWRAYYGWSADEKMVILMQSSVFFQMLPRRAVSREQAEDLISHLEQSGLRRI